VLEISAGTGRNMAYYSRDVERVVFSDLSFNMMQRAKMKWEAQPLSQRTYDAKFVVIDSQSMIAQVHC
jgi:ubiquinone/menaquinone biosynthesis C-methylase UbiE